MSDYIEIAKIIKTHGVRGDLTVELIVPVGDELSKITHIYVSHNNGFNPYFIEHINTKSKNPILKLEGINKVEEAAAFKGLKIFVQPSQIPGIENKLLPNALIGFSLKDVALGLVGKVVNVYDLPQNVLLEINYNGVDVLIPFQEALIVSVNRKNKELLLDLPQGLLDIYTLPQGAQDDGFDAE